MLVQLHVVNHSVILFSMVARVYLSTLWGYQQVPLYMSKLLRTVSQIQHVDRSTSMQLTVVA
jgi:hypothetical protein